MKNLFVLFLILTGSLAEATPKFILNIRQPRFTEELKQEITRITRTTQRQFNVYHYGNRGPIRYYDIPVTSAGQSSTPLKINLDEAIDLKRGNFGDVRDYQSPVELQPAEAYTYFEAMTNGFYTQKYKWMVGPGLYAAVDPIQSESYAGNPWFLMEIHVPKDTKYIEIRPANGLVLSKEFVQKWFFDDSGRDLSQVTITRISPDRFVLNLKSILMQPELWAIVKSAMQELDIQFIAYSWNREQIAPCLMRSFGQNIAFNFINPNFLKQKPTLNLYVSEIEENAAPEKLDHYSKLLDLIESGSLEFTTDPALPGIKRWSYREWAMRILTLGWNSVLHRTSRLLHHLLNSPLDLENLITFFVKLEPVIKDQAYLDTPIDLTGWTEIRRDASHAITYRMDPLTSLKSENPAEYLRRMNLIETTIFGCSPDPAYDVENEPVPNAI